MAGIGCIWCKAAGRRVDETTEGNRVGRKPKGGPRIMDRLAYDQLREELADLEHEQWAHWTEYMLANLTPENVTRWERQCRTPYSALTEREKNSDRKWADKVLEVLTTYTRGRSQ